VIDGGPAGVYQSALAPRLLQLKGVRPVLPIALMMVSHIDDDHIHGLLDLLRQMRELRNLATQLDIPINEGAGVQSSWHRVHRRLELSHYPAGSQ
jgi:glyoxylase-like metal-dependent hydrolase (beta-lactamase superfamily II)